MSLQSGQINSEDLSFNAGIQGTQIADGTIQQRNIAPQTIINTQIVDQTITSGQVAPAALGGAHAFVSNDGSNGDYTDIQSAIDDTSGAGGGIVFIREGTYLLQSNITVYSNITLVGETAGGVILDFQNAAYNLSVQGTNAYTTGTVSVSNLSQTVTGVGTSWDSSMVGQYILLSGIWYLIDAVASTTSLTIDIPFELLSISGQSYVIADPVSSATIQDLTIQNSTAATGAFYAQYGLYIILDTVNIYSSTIGAQFIGCSVSQFLGSFISSCGTGLMISNSSTWTLYNFEVYASTGDNIVLDTFYNVSFSNFTNSTAGGNGITATNSSNWGLYDFSTQSCGAIGMEFTSCSGIVIFGGNIEASASDGLKLNTGNSAMLISGNTLYSNTGYGINIADSSNTTNTVENTYFSGNTAGSLNDLGTSTMKSGNVPDNTTNNNFITDTDTTLAANSDLRLATQKAVKAYVDASPSGNVTGPGSSTSGDIVTFNGTTGKVIQDSGKVLPTGTVIGTSDSQALTNKDLSGAGNTFPTFNQNTTGSAAKWTTARNLAGNSVDGSANVAFANKFVVQGTTDSGLSAAQFLGALGTGIVKNTTTTGVLSIAANTDLPVGDATHSGAMPTPPNNTTTFLRGDATWASIPGGGDMLKSTYDPANIAQQLVGTTASQTLSSKTLTTPIINSGTMSGTISGVNANATVELAGGSATTNDSFLDLFGKGAANGGQARLTAGNAITSGGGNGGSVNLYVGAGDGAGVAGTVGMLSSGGSSGILFSLGGLSTSRTVTFPDAAGAVVLDTATQTLTTKSISLGSNTLTGTTAQFNTALTDNDFATLAGTETLTNKSITTGAEAGTLLNDYTATVVNISLPAGHDYTVQNGLTLGSGLGITLTTTSAFTIILVADLTNTQTLVNKTISDPSNTVSYAAFTNPYKFYVYRGNAWSTATNTTTAVPFDTVDFDTGGNFSTSTSLFTAPVAGFYQFNTGVNTTATVTRALIGLLKNGSEFKRMEDTGTITAASVALGGGALLKLAIGDTVGVMFDTPNGSVSGGTTSTVVWFTGYFIGPN